MKLLLDSNFLMVPFNYKIDIYEELKFSLGKVELYTLNLCINELKKLGKKKKIFLAAIDLANKKGVKIIKVNYNNVDDALLIYAKENDFALATVDSKLMREAKSLNIRVITIKNNKIIEM